MKHWLLASSIAFLVGCGAKPAPQAASNAKPPSSANPAKGIAMPEPLCKQGDLADCTRRCDLGQARSCTDLGMMYANGEGGVTIDVHRAHDLYVRACDGG